MSGRVFRDAWGIPHLRGDDERELAFLQGRTTATDRAWQLEFERHRAQGATAAFLGAEALGWDVFARRARLADTARRCRDNLDADTAAWVDAYVEGVNAGLAAGAARAPEFAATGLTPGRWESWTPLAVWLAHHILFAGFPAKLWREEVARRLGVEAIDLFAADGPAGSGSNGWLIPGHRSATGAALIAGDPHRYIENPGVYQQVRLACPAYDVVGLAVPGVPGIAHFGHAGPVAWAITNAMADYQDLFREQLRRDGATVRAHGPRGWEPATAHRETVEVAGGEPVEIEVIETARGPVIIGGPDEEPAISLRYPPRVRADLGFAALPMLLRARSTADVDRAFDHWAEPVNVVLAADVAGGLLHRVAGAVPLRHEENRRRVVPAADPGHQWRGWHAPMPRAAVEDVTVMANERGLAAGLGVEFAPPYRADRIRELLAGERTWSADRMAQIHTDTLLGAATPVLALLAGLDALSPAAARLRDRLLSWDRRMAAASHEAAAFAAVRSALVRRLAAAPSLAVLAEPMPYPAVFAPWLDLTGRVAFALGTLLGAELPGVDCAALAREALEGVAAAGPTGTWGDRHRLAPWQALPDPDGQNWPGLAGDHDCVLATSSVPGITDHCARGPAARYVWDLADRSRSRWIVPLGADGVPGAPHARDQLPLWSSGELIPVTTDWADLTEERDAD